MEKNMVACDELLDRIWNITKAPRVKSEKVKDGRYRGSSTSISSVNVTEDIDDGPAADSKSRIPDEEADFVPSEVRAHSNPMLHVHSYTKPIFHISQLLLQQSDGCYVLLKLNQT